MNALKLLNFRDLGGLPSGTGKTLKHGILYRSEGPASFTDVHHGELQSIGFRLICDLRSDGERIKAPHLWSGEARLMNLNITADLQAASNQGWHALKNDSTPETIDKTLRSNYAAIPAALAPHLRPFLEAIVQGESPALIHCTAGKDRTGVLVALLLELLDVPQDVVVADYLRSIVFADNLRLRGGIHEAFEEAFGFYPSEAVIDAMIGINADHLEDALAAAKSNGGSVRAYFEDAGVSASLIEKFRHTMLE